MKMVTTDHLREVRAAHEPPCLSLYQPTHRHHPNNKPSRTGRSPLTAPRAGETRITKCTDVGLKTQIFDHDLGQPVIRSEHKNISIKQYVRDHWCCAPRA